MKALPASLIGFGLSAMASQAALVTVTSVTASEWGDRFGNGPTYTNNRSGIDTSADPNDPSQWVFSGTAYQDEWMATPFGSPALNSKLAWISYDFGSDVSLETMYLFNNSYQGGISGTNQFNIYYTSSPAVALPATPTNNNFAVTGTSPQGDYDFSTWTLFNTSGNLSATQNATTTYDLTGVTARYVAIEILSNHGDTFDGGRVGMDEVAFTSIPEPSIALLSGLGFFILLRRRKR